MWTAIHHGPTRGSGPCERPVRRARALYRIERTSSARIPMAWIRDIYAKWSLFPKPLFSSGSLRCLAIRSRIENGFGEKTTSEVTGFFFGKVEPPEVYGLATNEDQVLTHKVGKVLRAECGFHVRHCASRFPPVLVCWLGTWSFSAANLEALCSAKSVQPCRHAAPVPVASGRLRLHLSFYRSSWQRCPVCAPGQGDCCGG